MILPRGHPFGKPVLLAERAATEGRPTIVGYVPIVTTQLEIRRDRSPETSSDLHDIVHRLGQDRFGSP